MVFKTISGLMTKSLWIDQDEPVDIANIKRGMLSILQLHKPHGQGIHHTTQVSLTTPLIFISMGHHILPIYIKTYKIPFCCLVLLNYFYCLGRVVDTMFYSRWQIRDNYVNS